MDKDLLTERDRLYILGVTEKGGTSRDHSFRSCQPYMYPLYKIHKLSIEQISLKIIPPARMVTASVNGPTYRIGIFLDSILKPVSMKYCRGELVKDSTEFLKYMESLNESGSVPKSTKLVALDVDALYPNIKIELALEAISDGLDTSSEYSDEQKKMIIELSKYALENSVVQFRGEWFKSTEGAPTGGPESPSIANLYVKYIIDKNIFVQENIKKLNMLRYRRRFLDDIWALWYGTYRTFDRFLDAFNKFGKTFGFTIKGDCSESVEFLDVTTSIEEGKITSKMYVKPTDSLRYLNRRSFHAPHTFSGIPYSQFRRASVICSNVTDRDSCIDKMVFKLCESGYSKEELKDPAKKAKNIHRKSILSDYGNSSKSEDDVITMVINRDSSLKKELQSFFERNKSEIANVIGDKRVIVAERRHANTSSLLFNKAGFSRERVERREHQRCDKSKLCKNCGLMNLVGRICCDGVDVVLDMKCCCITQSVIYVALCRHCKNGNYYFGQTQNSLQVRNRGHRYAFKTANSEYEKSALSIHVYENHIDKFGNELQNFNFGIVMQTSPSNLDKWEGY